MHSIQTNRLVLRNFDPKDALDIFEYLHRPVSSCFLSLALKDLEEAGNEVTKRSESDSQIAVCLIDSGKLIGDLFAEADGDTFSVGWNFNPLYGGKGYAHEAATALFAHLFIREQARRIYAYVEDTNTSSQKLCEKLGMRREGLFQEFVSFKKDEDGIPVYENTIQYAILSKEWRQLQNVEHAA